MLARAPTRILIAAGVVAALSACAPRATGSRPEDMSAEAHRHEADRHETEAAKARTESPSGSKYSGMGSISPDPITGDPVDGVWLPTDYDLGPGDTGALDAIEHEKHARHHRKAAKALEKFEAKECAEIPPEARVACPLLGPVTGFDAIEGGVRLHTDGRRPLSMLLSHARCHYAFGRASGFAEMASCPLYIEGLELELSPDGAGIDLTSPVPATAEEIRSRTATHVVPTVGGK